MNENYRLAEEQRNAASGKLNQLRDSLWRLSSDRNRVDKETLQILTKLWEASMQLDSAIANIILAAKKNGR